MPGEFITPIDETTGIPLPIYPNPNLPPVINAPAVNYERRGDWHHPFHPRDQLTRGSLGQHALRLSRIQWTEYNEHHDRVGYHHTFAGPPLPKSEEDLFKTVVFAAAKFVPEYAMAFNKAGTARIVSLGYDGRKRLLQDGIIRVDNNLKVKEFLLDYMARNGGVVTDQRMLVDEFLGTTNNANKLMAGRLLIHFASRATTAGIDATYRKAKKALTLPHQRSDDPSAFVANYLLMVKKSKPDPTTNLQSIKRFEQSLRLVA